MKIFIIKLKLFLLFFITGMSVSLAQYIHPNQAGRKGGDTGPGKGQQVVTTTYLGNAGNPAGQGVIMSVNKNGTNPSSFYEFLGFPGDGSYPFYTTPFQASDGNLYGSSFIGGSSNWGTVYKFNLSTATESVILNASPSTTGGVGSNYANVNELSDGKIYGIQSYGGSPLALGMLYRMDKDGSNFQVVHTFVGLTAAVNYSAAAIAQTTTLHYDGSHPYGFVVEGPDGKIYGTTYDGGSYGRGTVYRCDKDGTNYEVVNIGVPILKQYDNGRGGLIPLAYNGLNPWGNVAIDATGKVIVTTYFGGAVDQGALGKMDLDGSNYKLLHSGNVAEGNYPVRGALVIDDKVYGTFRYNGGSTLANGGGAGVIYCMNTDGSDYKRLKVFDNVGAAYTDGGEPWAGLSYDGESLYGTTLVYGGAGFIGTIFRIKPDGSNFLTIHRFSSTAGATCGAGTAGLYTYYPSAERVTFGDISSSLSKTCIPNKVCNSGSTSPTFSGGTTISNICPATTVDLTTIGASNQPANTVIKWHTATPAKASNLVANPAAVVAGTYYAVFYDAVNGCYGGVIEGSSTTAITVTINAPCCPAGSYAPPLAANKAINICPATTADLTLLEYGTPPSGSVVTWHTAKPVSTANKVANPTSVTAGTYYAAYYNSGATCYSPASSAVTTTIISCTGSSVVNPCPSTTINLNSSITSVAPSGTVLTWHTASPASTANKVATPSAVSATGVYYPAYYDATNDCYSVTGAPITATVSSCVALAAGTIDCSRTQMIPAPVAGTASNHALYITLNVTTIGAFTPVTVTGSGFTVNPSPYSVNATTTGLQTFIIPVHYDGTALTNSLQFTVGSAGSCTADMTKPAKVISKNIYSLDGCTAIIPGVLTK
jgi:uncharacterized repeat protein (TIGR03803 family)